MKLSEVLKYCPKFVEGEEYILIHKKKFPHASVINNPDELKYLKETKDYLLFQTNEDNNPQFICYYLRFNMKLLRGTREVTKTVDGYRLRHIDAKFIKNIKVDEFPCIEAQNMAVSAIDEKYPNYEKEKCRSITKLYMVNYNHFLNLEYPYDEQYYIHNLCKITNQRLFINKLIEGVFLENLVEIKRPDLVTFEFLMYSLYYDGYLQDLIDLKNDINEEESDYTIPNLIPLKDQDEFVKMLRPQHLKILEIKKKHKELKQEIRRFINSLVYDF